MDAVSGYKSHLRTLSNRFFFTTDYGNIDIYIGVYTWSHFHAHSHLSHVGYLLPVRLTKLRKKRNIYSNCARLFSPLSSTKLWKKWRLGLLLLIPVLRHCQKKTRYWCTNCELFADAYFHTHWNPNCLRRFIRISKLPTLISVSTLLGLLFSWFHWRDREDHVPDVEHRFFRLLS